MDNRFVAATKRFFIENFVYIGSVNFPIYVLSLINMKIYLFKFNIGISKFNMGISKFNMGISKFNMGINNKVQDIVNRKLYTHGLNSISILIIEIVDSDCDQQENNYIFSSSIWE